MKLYIAVGHSLTDPGAVSQFGNERDILIPLLTDALNICKTQNIKDEIVRVPDALDLDGAIAYINSRCNVANDLAVEIHLNSNAGTPGTGTETYHGFVLLAKEIHEEVVKVLKLRDRGLKEGNWLKFNNAVKCASCLLEMGFVNNGNDVAVIKERGALALAKGITRACNTQWVDVKPPVIEPPVVVTPPIVIPPVTPPQPPVVVTPPIVIEQPPIIQPPVDEPVEPIKPTKWRLILILLKRILEIIINKKG
jgi:hypothetical protein